MKETMRKVPCAGLLLSLVVSSCLSTFALAQQTPPATWAGWARCQVTVQGPGYTDQQTHTWTMTSGTPTAEGAFRVYAGTWSVVGGGSLSRTQGTQTLRAQWATNGPDIGAPIAVFVRASDNRMFIQSRHAQLRGTAAIQGYQQVTIDGMPQTPGRIAAEAFEWAFPVIAVSPPNPPATNATATGSSTLPVNGSVGLMQPAGSQATASCTWQFGQGSAAPVPPPTLMAQAIPTPPVPGGGTAPVPATGGPVTVAPNRPVTTTSPPAPVATPGGAVSVAPNPPATTTSPVPPAPSAGGATADLSIRVVGSDPTVIAVFSWPANGTATYVASVTNNGPGAANGATLAVPASAGLWKTSVSCYLAPQCPTVAQLESGYAFPNLPAGASLDILFSGTVTGAVGSQVSVTGTVSAPTGVSDANPANNSYNQTQSIVAPAAPALTVTPLNPSLLPTPVLAPPDPSLTVTPLNPSSLPTPVLCTLRGPGVGGGVRPSYATPGSVYLYWAPVTGATGYTVSRNDLGVLTSPANYAGTSFRHRGLVPHPMKYVYTIIAIYPQGCGRTDITIDSRPPSSPRMTYVPGSAAGSAAAGNATLTYAVPGNLNTRLTDFTGVLITGPTLPSAGKVGTNTWNDGIGAIYLTGVPAGNQTWTLKAYWDVSGVRVMDNTGTTITVMVP